MTIKISVGDTNVLLAPAEFRELYWNTKRMLEWGASGVYGDGKNITDPKNAKIAQSAINKLDKFFSR